MNEREETINCTCKGKKIFYSEVLGQVSKIQRFSIMKEVEKFLKYG